MGLYGSVLDADCFGAFLSIYFLMVFLSQPVSYAIFLILTPSSKYLFPIPLISSIFNILCFLPLYIYIREVVPPNAHFNYCNSGEFCFAINNRFSVWLYTGLLSNVICLSSILSIILHTACRSSFTPNLLQGPTHCLLLSGLAILANLSLLISLMSVYFLQGLPISG